VKVKSERGNHLPPLLGGEHRHRVYTNRAPIIGGMRGRWEMIESSREAVVLASRSPSLDRPLSLRETLGVTGDRWPAYRGLPGPD
jgi:hypothetical protein